MTSTQKNKIDSLQEELKFVEVEYTRLVGLYKATEEKLREVGNGISLEQKKAYLIRSRIRDLVDEIAGFESIFAFYPSYHGLNVELPESYGNSLPS